MLYKQLQAYLQVLWVLLPNKNEGYLSPGDSLLKFFESSSHFYLVSITVKNDLVIPFNHFI